MSVIRPFLRDMIECSKNESWCNDGLHFGISGTFSLVLRPNYAFAGLHTHDQILTLMENIMSMTRMKNQLVFITAFTLSLFPCLFGQSSQ
jgi:hypothetical protein